jgi:hypothetical protein
LSDRADHRADQTILQPHVSNLLDKLASPTGFEPVSPA